MVLGYGNPGFAVRDPFGGPGRERLFARRLKQAGVRQVKELSDFDWSFNPKIPRGVLIDLATAQFVTEHRHALLIGPPGTGKTHAVTAITVGAIRAGYRVLIRQVFDLAQDFAEAEATGERRDLVKKLCRADLLVLEDFGMKQLGPARFLAHAEVVKMQGKSYRLHARARAKAVSKASQKA